jgi:hypothetical protein
MGTIISSLNGYELNIWRGCKVSASEESQRGQSKKLGVAKWLSRGVTRLSGSPLRQMTAQSARGASEGAKQDTRVN